MNRYYIVLENIYEHDKQICHIIDIDENIPGGWYVQINMLSGFDSRIRKRFAYYFGKKDNPFIRGRYSLTREDELEFILELNNRFELVVDFELIFHKSVYEFFNYIGYNYKNKKVSHIDDKFLLKKPIY